MRKLLSLVVTFAMALGALAVIGSAPASGHGTGHTFSVGDITVNEGAGTATFNVTISQAPEAGETLSVNYATTDGTATAPADYTSTTGTLTFASGDGTTKPVNVPIVNDAASEGNEDFFLILSGPACSGTCSTGAPTLLDAQGRATITDNDTPTPTPTPTATPTPTPTPTPTVGTNTVRIGGYFQVRISGTPACIANRPFKIKKSQPGTDKVIVTGTTDSTGLYKVAKRPRVNGLYYAQIYPVTRGSTSCPAKKSPIRRLPA